MGNITRKGIAFNTSQLKAFDMLIDKKGYKNRSEAIRDIIRKELVDNNSADPDKRMMATLTMVYNHHEHHIQHELTHIQHTHNDLIRSSLHVHMDHNNCLEVLILEGKVKAIQSLSDSIIAAKGVKHGKLVLTGV